MVSVLAHVMLTGPPDGSELFTGAANKVTFSGTVSPQDVGARVVLQRQNASSGDEWHRIDVGQVGLGGTYSITHTFVIAGSFFVLAAGVFLASVVLVGSLCAGAAAAMERR